MYYLYSSSKESKTKIITPSKTYDLDDDLDEEMTEFKTFFSRRELKTINRRMQGGRVRSVENGNYIATNAPFGYDITFDNKSRTLKINEHEANVVKIIFNMYIEGNGAGTIANYLNSLGYKTKYNRDFTSSSILFILRNPVYVGKITWKKREYKKSFDPNKIKDCRTRDKSEWIISEGKHDHIVSDELFNKANEILDGRYHIPYKLKNPPANPFAGLIVCSKCGKKIILRKFRGVKRLMCTNKCGNKSIKFDLFESKVIKELENYLENYKISINNNSHNNDNIEIYNKQLSDLKKELTLLNQQKMNTFDLLERGIYSDEVFIERSNNIASRISFIDEEITKLKDMIEKEKVKVNINKITNFENILSAYKITDDIKLKNELLKSILEKIVYLREQDDSQYDFTVTIYTKLLRKS